MVWQFLVLILKIFMIFKKYLIFKNLYLRRQNVLHRGVGRICRRLGAEHRLFHHNLWHDPGQSQPLHHANVQTAQAAHTAVDHSGESGRHFKLRKREYVIVKMLI
jgi:hypothetical protein